MWIELKGTVEGVSKVFQAGMSDGMTPFLKTLTEALVANKSAFDEWGRGAGLLLDEVAARLLGAKSRLQRDIEATKALEVKNVEDRAKILAQRAEQAADPKAAEKTGEAIKRERADIGGKMRENVWDTITGALPVIGQSTISGSLNHLKQGYAQYQRLASAEKTLDEAHERIYGGAKQLPSNLSLLQGESPEIDAILKRLDLSPREKREMIAVRRTAKPAVPAEPPVAASAPPETPASEPPGWWDRLFGKVGEPSTALALERLSAAAGGYEMPGGTTADPVLPPSRPPREREAYLSDREMVYPRRFGQSGAGGGDYADNGGNSRTTNHFTFNQQITAPDPETAGREAARRTAEMLNSTYPGADGFGAAVTP